jgi:UDP-N-acetylmuramate--L-alanine ligase/UDP-N-acetylenolpyruvoylglucosamine reductase
MTLTKQQLTEFLGSGPRRVHFVGIGGAGMSGLARLLLQQGHRVTGSDAAPNGEVKPLEKLGARVWTGHAREHVQPDTELLVHTSAVNGANAELQAAADLRIPVVRRGLLLAALMSHRCNIAVAGTHGKTTTTAMIAQVLMRSDSAPTFCVGAPVPVLGASSQCGAGKYFVAEACESDGTLIHYTPDIAVCLNIEPEHLDHHGSMERLLANFETFCRSTLGTVYYCADCAHCAAVAGQARAAISFGLSDRADYRAVEIAATARGSRFVVLCRGERLATVELVIPGRQNVSNALAAFAVADQLQVPVEKIVAALGEFTGAKRRFDRKYNAGGITVVDDYAHHPTEIQATIAAAQTLGFRRIVLAFQPHRYTRTRNLLPEFATAFRGVDKLYLTDIYAASEPPLPGITGQLLFGAVKGGGQKDAVYEPDFDRLMEALYRDARPGDLIMTMGAGNIYKVGEALAKRLAAARPAPARSVEALAADVQQVASARTRVMVGERMAGHTTLRVGGPAELWIEPWDERDLAALLKFLHHRDIPVTVVGRGSNLLVRDGGIPGVVISLKSEEFTRAAVDGERLFVRAGTRLKTLVNLAREHEVGGLEFLEGIPGSVGGALRMNAGAMGRQTFDVVEWIRYVSASGEIYDAEAKTLPVAYRSCPMLANHVALSAIFRGEKTSRAVIEARLREFGDRRRATQPAQPSAGCIFKNPRAIPAGRLIDELGLKGTRIGGARVSEVHANFIVNDGGATASDILELIEVIRRRARQERGIELETEVQILGREA